MTILTSEVNSDDNFYLYLFLFLHIFEDCYSIHRIYLYIIIKYDQMKKREKQKYITYEHKLYNTTKKEIKDIVLF